MRRFARLPSRILAVAGAVFVGAIGAVALTSPASAHAPIVKHSVKCGETPGTAIVWWEIGNDYGLPAKLRHVSPETGEIRNGADLAPVGGAKLSGELEYKLSAKEAVLTFDVKWKDGFETQKPVVDKVDLTKLECAPAPKQEVEFTDNCDGTVLVKVTNPKDAREAVKFRINGTGEWNTKLEVEPGKSAEATVPAAHAERVNVRLNNDNDVYASHRYTKPDGCGLPTVAHKSDCTNLTITVSNPADGKPSLEVTATAGETVIKKTVAAGKTEDFVFAGSDGLSVVLTSPGKEDVKIDYAKPASCNPGLPVTGVNAGLLAGAALVLVSGGAGLFFAARRRRIRFAA